MWWYVITFLVGAWVGIFLMAALVISRDAQDD